GEFSRPPRNRRAAWPMSPASSSRRTPSARKEGAHGRRPPDGLPSRVEAGMSDTHWKARRLAARSLKVLARHGDEPAIAAYTTTLGPKATTYIREDDTAGKHEAAWRREMAEGHGAMGALQKEMNAWKPHVARERPGFDLTTIGDRPTVPEDLVQDAIAMAEELEAVRDAEGNTPEWAIAAAASIREKAVAAERET